MTELVKKLLRLPEEFPPAANLPMNARARIVLIEEHGCEPSQEQIRELCLDAEWEIELEEKDRGFLQATEMEQSSATGKRLQTGGGHRVIRKPGLFGG